MNFETLSRFHFKPIEKFERNSIETIRILPNKLTMTNALVDRMGKPEYISFGYDAEEKALGVKVTTKNDPNAVFVKYYKSSANNVTHGTFVCSKIRDEMGIAGENDKVVVMKRCFKVDEWFVFQLRFAEVQPKCGRKKRSA